MASNKESPDENIGAPSTPVLEVPEFYVNSTIVQINVYDFMLEFGLSYPDGRIESVVNVRMSPQHAWVFLQVLRRTFNIYLENIGKISLPEQFLKEKDLLDIYNQEILGKLGDTDVGDRK